MPQPNEAEIAAERRNREIAGETINEMIVDLERRAKGVEASDPNAALLLRRKIPGLQRKREEILRGERRA